MGRFDPKYTPQQRQAVTDAVLEHGYRVADAIRAAETGTLPAKLPAFKINRQTAYGLVRDERAKLEGRTNRSRLRNPQTARLAAWERLQKSWDAHATRHEKRLADGKSDLNELTQLARAAREIEGLSKGHAPGSRPVKGEQPPAPPTKLAKLITEERQAPTSNRASNSEHVHA